MTRAEAIKQLQSVRASLLESHYARDEEAMRHWSQRKARLMQVLKKYWECRVCGRVFIHHWNDGDNEKSLCPMHHIQWRVTGALALLGCFMLTLVCAGQVSPAISPPVTNRPAMVALTWNQLGAFATNNGVEQRVVQYKIYCGQQSMVYVPAWTATVTNALSTWTNADGSLTNILYVVFGPMTRGQTFFFNATAVDNLGLEGNYGQELRYFVPGPTTNKVNLMQIGPSQ